MHQALLCLVVSLQEHCYFFQRRSKQHDFVGVQQHQVALAASEATPVLGQSCLFSYSFAGVELTGS
jgi:hypothetical protein